jgi:hypothetical protein
VSKIGKFSTHHVPNEGIWFTPGEIVRLDESGRQVQIVKDPLGEYEVHSCRHATEYTGTPALLRVGLRRGPLPERTENVSSLKAYGV